MRTLPTGRHKTGQEGVRLAVQPEVDLAPCLRRDEDGLSRLDLFACAVQRQTQDIVVFAEVRVRGDLRPASRTEIRLVVLRNGDVLRNGMGLARPASNTASTRLATPAKTSGLV
jgi:hypothetical protein